MELTVHLLTACTTECLEVEEAEQGSAYGTTRVSNMGTSLAWILAIMSGLVICLVSAFKQFAFSSEVLESNFIADDGLHSHSLDHL